MSKEAQFDLCAKIQRYYTCNIITNDTREPYCLFNLNDIGRILQIKNIRSTTRNLDKTFIKCETHGGDQTTAFISYNELYTILSKSRLPSVIEFCERMELNTKLTVYSCIETDTLRCIMESFENENMIRQHRIGPYIVDLYIPTHKIIIECDETHHISNTEHDKMREANIRNLLDGCIFIRYKPFDKGFSIFKTINEVYMALKTRII
jgi:very-short-patch-repair endonuclease